jgi:hypothetical protein
VKYVSSVEKHEDQSEQDESEVEVVTVKIEDAVDSDFYFNKDGGGGGTGMLALLVMPVCVGVFRPSHGYNPPPYPIEGRFFTMIFLNFVYFAI